MDKKEFELPETFDINGVEIFAEGVWNGDRYTAQDIEDMVRSFEETKGTLRPYLKLGHDNEQLLAQRDGLPAVGWIERLRKVGTKLVADFVKVPKKVYELIQSGAYRRVSSEIFFNIKIGEKMFKRALKAVSLLGADTPAVQNLEDIMAMYSEAGLINVFDNTEAEVKIYEMKGDDTMADEKKPEVPVRPEVPEVPKEEVKENAKGMPDMDKIKEENDGLKKQIAELKAEMAKIKKASEESEAQLLAHALDAKRKVIESEVDKFIADPKTFAQPVDKDSLCKLWEHLESVEVKTFKVGEEEKTTTQIFTDLLGRERAVLNSEGKTEIGETGGDVDGTALRNKAKQYAKEHNVSYKEALLELK